MPGMFELVVPNFFACPTLSIYLLIRSLDLPPFMLANLSRATTGAAIKPMTSFGFSFQFQWVIILN